MQEIKYNHEQGVIPDAIAKFPLFSLMNSGCLNKVLDHASIVRLDAGEEFLKDGDKRPGLFVLLRGEFVVSKNGKQVATIKKPGDLIGEMGFVLNQPHQASVTAIGKASVLKIDGSITEALPGKFKDHFQYVMYRHLTELLAERLANTSAQLTNSGSGPVYYL